MTSIGSEATHAESLEIATGMACSSCTAQSLVSLLLVDDCDDLGGPIAVARRSLQLADGIHETMGVIRALDMLVGALAAEGRECGWRCAWPRHRPRCDVAPATPSPNQDDGRSARPGSIAPAPASPRRVHGPLDRGEQARLPAPDRRAARSRALAKRANTSTADSRSKPSERVAGDLVSRRSGTTTTPRGARAPAHGLRTSLRVGTSGTVTIGGRASDTPPLVANGPDRSTSVAEPIEMPSASICWATSRPTHSPTG